MTRDEAIEYFHSIRPIYTERGQESIDMAIEALSQPPNDDWEKYSDRLWHEAFNKGKASAQSSEVHEITWRKIHKCVYRCSRCGKFICADNVNELNYCCNCGGKRREKKQCR